MTIRELISHLLDTNCSIDDNVEIYVSAKTDIIKEYLDDDSEWCLDEILCIDEIEDRGGHVWLKAEEIR